MLIFVNFKNYYYKITMGSVQSVEEKIVDQGDVVGVVDHLLDCEESVIFSDSETSESNC